MSFIVVKDPQAILDYGVDWNINGWLGTDTILVTSPPTGSTWIVPAGLTVEAQDNTATITTVWLSGGTVGQRYTITNRILTTAGRTDERSLVIVVKDR